MKYFEIDYVALLTLDGMGEGSVEALAHELSRKHYGYLHRAKNLAAILAALEAGGYVCVGTEGGVLSPSSPVSLTEKGLEALRISGMAKLFSGMKDKAIQKNTKAFCALERPCVRPFVTDDDAFAAYNKTVTEGINDAALWHIRNAEEGLYTLSLQRFPSYEEEKDAPEMSGITWLADADGVRRMLHDFLDTALYFCTSPKARKILLSTAGRAYVLTFCEVADETGAPVIRVTAAPILFNRQRFVGKRDAELDYAQCGDNVLSFTLSNVYAFCTAVFYSVIDQIDLFDEELGRKVNELYSKID